MEFIDNNEFESNQDSKETEVVSFEEKKEEKKTIPFAFWTVGENTYKLKLNVAEQVELESKFKRNLLSMMGDADNIPPITTMLQITHASMKPYHHGVKLKDVQNLYEKYISEGGNMMLFYADIYLKIFMVSGFFSFSMSEDMAETLDKASEEMS